MKLDLVVAGYLVQKGKVLLVLHKKLGKWLPPGGHIEKDETPDEALKREFREELGINIDVLNFNKVTLEGNIKRNLPIPFSVNVHRVGDHDHCCLFYVCHTSEKGGLKPNHKEVMKLSWFSAKELKGPTVTPDMRNLALLAMKLGR